ncbi:MAG: hypothetical protein KC931_14485 [Candidatus Omnitrophica bacterium]|nr:hypothetical protein [Candidatus Omnitrophota bacterium]MCA9427952.1 hypothetical protein [Candidatus Omnitrophota bacterium]MCA9441242.1 hypothetical protein [Candidatus Omnitrophota bacterium]MCA9448324.1 hypothetical protein [Candidatus Omnitrophota bacterium]
MNLKGHVEDGHIVLDQPFDLPNGAEVEILIKGHVEGKKSTKTLDDFVGIIPPEIDVRAEYYKDQMTRDE